MTLFGLRRRPTVSGTIALTAIAFLGGLLGASLARGSLTFTSTGITSDGALNFTSAATSTFTGTLNFPNPVLFGTSTIASNGLFHIGTSSPIFFVSNNGDVGIDTQSPGAPLEIDTPSGANGFFILNTIGGVPRGGSHEQRHGQWHRAFVPRQCQHECNRFPIDLLALQYR